MSKKLVLNTLFLLVLTILFAQVPVLAQQAKGTAEMYAAFKVKKCKMCHRDIWTEWEKSQHAKAWTDPVFKEYAGKYAKKEECGTCHAAEPILINGIGKMPKLRNNDREFGVFCLVCHMDADGAMHGPAPTKQSPFHSIIADESVNAMKICGTCHGQKDVPQHNQMTGFEIYKKSPAAKEGEDCITCHMPQVERKRSVLSPKITKVRTHVWTGGHAEAQLKQAAALEVKVSPGKVTAIVTNKAGHSLPGTAIRQVILDVKVTSGGKEVLHKQEIYERPYEISDESKDTRIKAGESSSVTYDIGETSGKVDVKLIYKNLPTTPDDKVVVIAETSQTF